MILALCRFTNDNSSLESFLSKSSNLKRSFSKISTISLKLERSFGLKLHAFIMIFLENAVNDKGKSESLKPRVLFLLNFSVYELEYFRVCGSV